MRLNAALLALALVGVVAGAALIGRWAVGCAIICDSVLVGAWALLRDVPETPMRGDQRDLIRWRRAS
jgi:fatty acid desaturase